MRKPPEDSALDRLQAALSAGASGAAGALAQAAGAPPGAAEALVAYALGFLSTPVQRRRDSVMADFGAALQDLKRRVGKLEDLENNDAFLDTVFAAIPVAMRSASETKRRALRNAIVNAGLPGAPDATKQQLFVRLLDDLTDLHAHLLDILASPQAWFQKHNMALPLHRGPTGMAFEASTSEARLEMVLRIALPAYAAEWSF